jgi:hypothetical protein
MAGFVAPGLYQNPLLTNVSLRYNNNDLFAERLFPVITVPKRTGVYFVYDKENYRVPTSTLRASQSRAERTSWNMTKATYGPLLEHTLEIGLDDDDIDQEQDPLNLRIDAATLVTEKVMLEKEQTLANYLSNTAVVTQNVTKSGTSQWNDYTNSIPFTDVQVGRSLMIAAGSPAPNTAAFNQQVWDQLKNHPDLLDRVKFSQLGQITTGLLTTLFEVQNVYIMKALKNTSVDPQADSLSYIWGKIFLLMYITPQPGLRTVSLGYHLTQEGKRYMDSWFEQGIKTELVRYTDYYQPYLIAKEAAYLIKNVVA